MCAGHEDDQLDDDDEVRTVDSDEQYLPAIAAQRSTIARPSSSSCD